MRIRELAPEDQAGWLELWAGYLRFYRAEVSDKVTRTTFERLSGSRPACSPWSQPTPRGSS